MDKKTSIKPLTGKQRRQLRALGHHLNPVVQVGKEGVSESLVMLGDRELNAHELVKVKVLPSAPEDTKESAEALATQLDAHLAQVLGRTALLYRPRAEKPTIVLE